MGDGDGLDSRRPRRAAAACGARCPGRPGNVVGGRCVVVPCGAVRMAALRTSRPGSGGGASPVCPGAAAAFACLKDLCLRALFFSFPVGLGLDARRRPRLSGLDGSAGVPGPGVSSLRPRVVADRLLRHSSGPFGDDWPLRAAPWCRRYRHAVDCAHGGLDAGAPLPGCRRVCREPSRAEWAGECCPASCSPFPGCLYLLGRLLCVADAHAVARALMVEARGGSRGPDARGGPGAGRVAPPAWHRCAVPEGHLPVWHRCAVRGGCLPAWRLHTTCRGGPRACLAP